MKKYAFLFLLFTLSVLACDNDDENPAAPEAALSYDGANNTGPLLAAGFYETAARFPASETAGFAGRQLVQVAWFMGPAPAECFVKIYAEGTEDEPGNLIYQAEVTSDVRTLNWNRHDLSVPVDITGEDLWISIAVVHNGQQQSIGCDDGPRHPNGDRFFRDSNNEWTTYEAVTNESINWNIRGIVSE